MGSVSSASSRHGAAGILAAEALGADEVATTGPARGEGANADDTHGGDGDGGVTAAHDLEHEAAAVLAEMRAARDAFADDGVDNGDG